MTAYFQHIIDLDLESAQLTLICESAFNPSNQDIETLFQVFNQDSKIEFDSLTKADQEFILNRVNNLTANETQKIIDYYYDEKQNYIPEANQHD